MRGAYRGLRKDAEALLLGGRAEAIVEADKLVTCDTAISPHEGCGQLQSIGRAERMQQKHAPGRLTDLVAWLNLGPVSY